MTVEDLLLESDDTMSHILTGMHIVRPAAKSAIPDDLAEAIAYLARVAEHYRDSR
jgi:hypothetical protein